VGHWRSYGPIEHEGIRYGQRVHSFRGLMELPRRAPARFEVALGIHPDERRDMQALGANGWKLIDPMAVAPTPDRYREFVQGSKAEIGIAKSGYVASRCGWFSDRSAAYLASGRPVVAQETGFSRFLPTGEGLLAFETVADAAEQVEKVERDSARHGAAAREIAVEHLDSDRVLGSLLERLGTTR
jgi:glycosyl transferase family 1